MGRLSVMKHTPMATLRFFCENLPPDLVGEIVREKPQLSAKKGEKILSSPRGRGVAAKTGTWFITTENKHLGPNPAIHLRWVVGLAKDHIDELRRRVPGVMADMSLLVHGAEFRTTDLPKELVESAVQIGDLEIEVPANGIDITLNSANFSSEFH